MPRVAFRLAPLALLLRLPELFLRPAAFFLRDPLRLVSPASERSSSTVRAALSSPCLPDSHVVASRLLGRALCRGPVPNSKFRAYSMFTTFARCPSRFTWWLAFPCDAIAGSAGRARAGDASSAHRIDSEMTRRTARTLGRLEAAPPERAPGYPPPQRPQGQVPWGDPISQTPIPEPTRPPRQRGVASPPGPHRPKLVRDCGILNDSVRVVPHLPWPARPAAPKPLRARAVASYDSGVGRGSVPHTVRRRAKWRRVLMASGLIVRAVVGCGPPLVRHLLLRGAVGDHRGRRGGVRYRAPHAWLHVMAPDPLGQVRRFARNGRTPRA